MSHEIWHIHRNSSFHTKYNMQIMNCILPLLASLEYYDQKRLVFVKKFLFPRIIAKRLIYLFMSIGNSIFKANQIHGNVYHPYTIMYYILSTLIMSDTKEKTHIIVLSSESLHKIMSLRSIHNQLTHVCTPWNVF